MNKLLLFIFIGISIQGYAKDKFVLNGQVPSNYNGQAVSLYVLTPTEERRIGEAEIKTGQFVFKGVCYPKDLAEIRLGSNRYPIFLEEGELSFKRDSVNTIDGSPSNRLYQSYCDSIRYYENQLKVLLPWITVGNGAYQDLRYGSPAHAMYIQYGRFLMNFKRENLPNAVGKQAVLDALRADRPLEAESMRPDGKGSLDSTFQVILSICDTDFKKHSQFVAFQELLDRKKQNLKEQTRLIGTQYTDFKLQTIDGKEVAISDYIGKSKLLVIDFWASWCGACLVNLPELKKAYEEYHSKGVDIISISLDAELNSWKNMVEKHKMPWPQLSDLKGKDSDLAEAYDANAGIPRIIILDENGKILHYSFGGPVRMYIDMVLKRLEKKSE